MSGPVFYLFFILNNGEKLKTRWLWGHLRTKAARAKTLKITKYISKQILLFRGEVGKNGLLLATAGEIRTQMVKMLLPFSPRRLQVLLYWSLRRPCHLPRCRCRCRPFLSWSCPSCAQLRHGSFSKPLFEVQRAAAAEETLTSPVSTTRPHLLPRPACQPPGRLMSSFLKQHSLEVKAWMLARVVHKH